MSVEAEHVLRYEGQFEDVDRTDIYQYISSHWTRDDDDTLAIVNTSDEHQLTYRQLRDLIDKTSRDMLVGGVGHGSVVTVWCGNCLEIIVVVMAAWKLGALIAMIGPSLTTDEAKRQITKINTCFLFADESHALTATKKLFENDRIQNLFELNKKKFLALSQSEYARPNVSKINPDNDTALILFSSGTTGYPKAVELTHTNLLLYLHLSGPKLTDRTMPPTIHYLPLSHFYGFSMVLRCLCDLSQMYLMSRFQIEEYIRLVEKYKIPVLFLVPPVAVMMTKRPDLLKKYDLSCVLAMFSAAAPMPAGIEKELSQLLPGLVFNRAKQGYGMTETTGTVTRAGVGLGDIEPVGSVGKVLPFVELKVIDEKTGRSCGPNEQGELAVRGPLNMKGYFNDAKATADIFDSEGWLHTGDIGYYDENGFVFIVDRAKELIKCRGNQVSPAELEDIILLHSEVSDVAVVGLPDQLAGELPLAFVVRKLNSSLTEKQLQQFVAERVAPYKQLTGGVRFVDSIPKLATGKILRRQLRDSLRTSHKL